MNNMIVSRKNHMPILNKLPSESAIAWHDAVHNSKFANDTKAKTSVTGNAKNHVVAARVPYIWWRWSALVNKFNQDAFTLEQNIFYAQNQIMAHHWVAVTYPGATPAEIQFYYRAC